jgi:hypothetical protein
MEWPISLYVYIYIFNSFLIEKWTALEKLNTSRRTTWLLDLRQFPRSALAGCTSRARHAQRLGSFHSALIVPMIELLDLPSFCSAGLQLVLWVHVPLNPTCPELVRV